MAIEPDTKPTVREARVPYINWVKTSRPKLSVPSKASAEGGSYRPPTVAIGSVRPEMAGPRKPKIAIRTNTPKLNRKRALSALPRKELRSPDRKLRVGGLRRGWATVAICHSLRSLHYFKLAFPGCRSANARVDEPIGNVNHEIG